MRRPRAPPHAQGPIGATRRKSARGPRGILGSRAVLARIPLGGRRPEGRKIEKISERRGFLRRIGEVDVYPSHRKKKFFFFRPSASTIFGVENRRAPRGALGSRAPISRAFSLGSAL